jgi:hypothetical protein
MVLVGIKSEKKHDFLLGSKVKKCFPKGLYDKIWEYRIAASSISASFRMHDTIRQTKNDIKTYFYPLMVSQVRSVAQFKYEIVDYDWTGNIN